VITKSDSKSVGVDIHDEARDARDTSHTGDEAPLIQEPRQDALDTNVGHATDDAPRGCHVHLLTFSHSEFFADQACNPGTNPITSRPQISTKHFPRTRKHRSSRRSRTRRNHHKDQGRMVRHRWMTTLSRKFPLPGIHTFSDLAILSCRCQFPMDRPAQKIVYDSPLREEPEEEFVEQDPTVPESPSLSNRASPSPPPTLQIPPQVDYRSDPISPEDSGESPGADESQDTRPHASSEEMSQHSPLDADDDHSGSDLVSPEDRDHTARTDDGLDEILHASPRAPLQDPPPHIDYNDSEPHTDPQDTLGSGNALGGDVNDKGTGELPVINLFLALLRSA